MSNVKGNDIDDLFKRASDKYPLRTDSADWNKLAADLDKDRSLIIPPANMEGGGKRKRRRFFWLFLLLPLGGIGYYAVQSSKQSRATVQHGAPQTPAKAGGDQAGTAQAVPSGKGSNPGDPVSAGTPLAGTPSGTTARETPASPASVYSADRKDNSARKNHTTENARKNHTDESNSQTNPSALASNPPSLASNPPTGSGLSGGQTINRQLTNRSSTEGQITGKRKRRNQATEQPVSEEQGAVGRTADDARSLGNRNSGTTTGDQDLSLSALKSSRARTSGDIALNIPVNAKPITVAAKDSSGSKKNTKNKKEAFFYAGLIVAPDLSTIKMQSVKGVGTTFGVLLGYQFNRRWAVETGVYLDHKKYYTDGEYFKNGSSNGTYKILTVNGYCNMWEIPVNVRYNLNSGEKTKWFASAGMSTYLMTRENYVSKINASGWIYDSPWDIKKPSQYWFSVVNLSVGLEQKLGRIGNLRLEPYLRIPLKGLGTGSLPIMSAGLNIGITRRIW